MVTKMKLRGLIIWGVVIVTALSAPLFANWISTTIAERRWAEVKADAKKLGLPLDPESALARYRPGPDSENAAEGVKVVLRKMVKPARTDASAEFIAMKDELRKAAELIQIELGKGSNADIKRLKNLLQPFKPFLDDFENALQRPSWNFKRNWKQGVALPYSDIRHLKVWGRILMARSRVNWEEKPMHSIGSLKAMFRLANHLESEPAPICIEAGCSIRVTGFHAAMYMATAPGAAANRRLILNLLAEPIPKIDWQLLWRSENATLLHSLTFSADMEKMGQLGIKESDGFPVRSYRSIIDTSATMGRLMVDAEAGWQGQPNTLATMELVSDKDAREIESVATKFWGNSAYSTEPSPTYRVRSEEAYRRLSYLVVLMAIQGKAGKLPSEALLPEWADPFGGKPLKLVPSGSVYNLYSIGLNRTDDGGSRESDDIVLRIGLSMSMQVEIFSKFQP